MAKLTEAHIDQLLEGGEKDSTGNPKWWAACDAFTEMLCCAEDCRCDDPCPVVELDWKDGCGAPFDGGSHTPVSKCSVSSLLNDFADFFYIKEETSPTELQRQWEEAGEFVLDFGRYKGRTIRSLGEDCPDTFNYLAWVMWQGRYEEASHMAHQYLVDTYPRRSNVLALRGSWLRGKRIRFLGMARPQ